MDRSKRCRCSPLPAYALALLTPLLILFMALPALAGEPPPDSEYAGSDTCAECHEDTLWHDSIHMRIESFEVQGANVGCEGCHGPAESHAAEGDPELIRTFTASSGTDVCMSCHARKALHEWPASTHAAEAVGCLDCHGVHTAQAPEAACASCHADVETQFQMPSHHPVREGMMSRSSTTC